MATYQIHPSVGVARVGNSRDSFYLQPDAIGGRPYECDRQGNMLLEHGRPVPVKQYKDKDGRVRRQGALFRVFRTEDDESATEVTTGLDGVANITWTVHLANKKAAWYSFSELEGNLMFGEDNSYGSRQVPLRNAGTSDRQSLIIDPGPRTVAGPGQSAEFDRNSIPEGYKHGSFPPADPSQGYSIDTLGGLRTDDRGRLVVLGGLGKAGGNDDIEGFGGADTWNDDISDGAVYCTVELEDGTSQQLTAWCIVGSPKFAPELVNPVTLDDNVFDVAVRYHGLVPEMYADGAFNTGYRVNFDRDVLPIIRRPLDSLWVANVPTMAVFSAPRFDVRDNSDALGAARRGYASYFRRPAFTPGGQQDQLWSGDNDPGTGSPMMPLQSGSNSVWNILIDKFLTLTETQYFCLQQWAEGHFDVGPASDFGIHALDRASLGNCVGGPMCPGIEVTWTTTNPSIFDRDNPFRILHAYDEEHYRKNGLNAMREETTEPPAPGRGCEPGDLTKRMAIPWQADFFQCTVQFINYTNPDVNKDASHIPIPPTFYGYWWPPQSPMFVLSGYTSWEEQRLAGVPAGFQVNYSRGINSFGQMITSWQYMGFIVNQNEAEDRTWYPYFVEKERNHDQFVVATVAVGGADQFVNADNTTFWPVWYLKSDDQPPPPVPSGMTPASAVDKMLGETTSGEKTFAELDRPRPVRAPARPGFGRRHHPEPREVAVAETEDTSSSHK
jgi:L-lysine 6-oxidase